jgi:hypothetical protein
MTKPNVPVPLARVLAADEKLAAWKSQHAREERLLRAVRRLLPRPLAERVFAREAGPGLLELSTSAGAIAAVVRQKGPQLLADLAREGWEFTGIRVRVQPRAAVPGPTKRVPLQWDTRAKPPLAALCASLPDGPLKVALGRMLRRLG